VWLALSVVAGAASITLSWQRWINPFVDSSRELIVPLRVASGERLYSDVAYFYGPAGPWLSAVALKTFGNRLEVLHALGLLLSVALFFSLFRLTARAGSALSAGVAVTLAAALCLGAPNGGAFLFPYSFSFLYALAGGFVCLSLVSGPSSPPRNALAAAGLTLALTARPEIGAAAALVLLVGFLRSRDRRREAGPTLFVIGSAGLLSVILYAIAFGGVSRSDLYPGGPFALFSPPQEWRNVYRAVSGLADPAATFQALATAVFLDVAILAAAYLAASKAGAKRSARAVGIVWFALLVVITAFFATAGASIEDRLPPLLTPLPLAAAAAALFLLRSPLDPQGRARFLLFGFSAVVGARVFFRLAYGAITTPFSILALPGLAAAGAVLALDLLGRRNPNPAFYRRLVAAVFLALAVVGVFRQHRFFPEARALVLRTAAGTLRLPAEKAIATAEALEFLRREARPGDGLAGFPEAGFFNFVTGLKNPLREDAIWPGHLDSVNTSRVVHRIEGAGPRFVLLVNQPAPAFGPTAFGRDYAVEVWDAVERHYLLVAAFGDPRPDAPVGSPQFFIRVYERRPDAEGPG